ncbi:MAG: inhibitor of cysteine peptidase [Methyloprofundus sp.]|nr:MAG: inhibitor of cysteine peptidase [Methyloprofundus sp.]
MALALSFLGNLLATAYACLPPLDTQAANIAQKAQNSTYVFAGTVTEINDTHVVVAVDQYFKGSGLSEVKITDFNSHSCSDYLIVNQHALFFTTGSMGGTLKAVYDGAFGSIRTFDATTFAEITAANKCMASYENGLLKIPCITTKGLEKVYQVFLEKTQADNRMELVLTLAKPAPTIEEQAFVDSIEVLAIAPAAAHIEVKVTGYFSNGCGSLGTVYINKIDNEFSVTLTQLQTGTICTTAIVPFEKIITLKTAGLASGDYVVNVNGKQTTFTFYTSTIESQ